MKDKLKLNTSSLVIEIASNDGYLLRNFKNMGIPSLGIEPAQNLAKIANSAKILTKSDFFSHKLGDALAADGYKADLVIANNVLSHVPELNDFIAGLKAIMLPHALLTVEFHQITELLKFSQFDTIYHEHYSYFSLFSAIFAFKKHGLQILDVEKLPSHGGSLRLYVHHSDQLDLRISDNVTTVLSEERTSGLCRAETYQQLSNQANKVKKELIRFLHKQKDDGKLVAAYGAAAKGATLLNYCDIQEDLIKFVADRNPFKQGKYMPGSRVKIVAPEKLINEHPDYVLILPWNLKDEIRSSIRLNSDWKGKFVTAIPHLEIFW